MIKDPQNALMSLEEAVAWRENLRKNGKKLVITNGCFDLLHRGHASYLRDSRNLGDALLVLINSDESVAELKGPSRPVNDAFSRGYLLASLEAVDAVVVFQGMRCNRELASLKPDIYVKGSDYTLDKLDPDERKALQEHGAEICFKPFVSGFSTTRMIERIVAGIEKK